MTHDAQIAAWAGATAAPLVLNFLTKQRPDAIGLSAMLVLIWCLGRVFSALWLLPESMALYPLIDALAGMTAFYAWSTRPQPWKLVLTSLYVGQCAAHLAFWTAWPLEGSLVRYLWANNFLYALQLLCVASPGAVHVSSLFLRSLPRGLGPFHHARFGPWR